MCAGWLYFAIACFFHCRRFNHANRQQSSRLVVRVSSSPCRYNRRHANTWFAFTPCDRATRATDAQVLLADLVDRQGFEAFRIAYNLDEIRPVKNWKHKQAFYFDDFLGKTTIEKVEKNEDQRLLELIEEVASNPNWRFILTTREYILNTAKLRYEAFAHPTVDLAPPHPQKFGDR